MKLQEHSFASSNDHDHHAVSGTFGDERPAALFLAGISAISGAIVGMALAGEIFSSLAVFILAGIAGWLGWLGRGFA